MKNPLDGLRLGASNKSIALADASVDQIVSGLSEEQKAGVAAALGADASAPIGQPKGEKEPPEGGAGKGGDGGEQGGQGAAPEPPKSDAADPAHPQFANGFQAAVERSSAVFASEHFEGREKAAAKLLGNPKLSAEEIVATLAELPKGDGGVAMLAGLKGNNPDLGAASDGERTSAQEAGASWGRTFARLGWGDKNK